MFAGWERKWQNWVDRAKEQEKNPGFLKKILSSKKQPLELAAFGEDPTSAAAKQQVDEAVQLARVAFEERRREEEKLNKRERERRNYRAGPEGPNGKSSAEIFGGPGVSMESSAVRGSGGGSCRAAGAGGGGWFFGSCGSVEINQFED